MEPWVGNGWVALMLEPPNNAMQSDKANLSRLLLMQKPRQFAFAADRGR